MIASKQERAKLRALRAKSASSPFRREPFNTMQPTNPEPGHKFQFLIPAILLTLMLLFAATSVAQQQSPQELISKADEILQQMSRITGLPIKGAVKKQVISRPEIEKYLIQNLHQEMTP